MCMATDKLSIMCDNVVGDGSNVSYMQVGDIPCNRMFCYDCVKKFFKEDAKQLVLMEKLLLYRWRIPMDGYAIVVVVYVNVPFV